MADVTKVDVDECIRAVASLWSIEVEGSGHEREADQASANLMSGSGLLYAPSQVLEVLAQAIEIGYASALKRVQDGYYDSDIVAWRPDLPEQ